MYSSYDGFLTSIVILIFIAIYSNLQSLIFSCSSCLKLTCVHIEGYASSKLWSKKNNNDVCCIFYPLPGIQLLIVRA